MWKKSNIGYDLDTSGGLMPQIHILTAPPSTDELAKGKKREGRELHPYYKRPGMGHNRDTCDSCGEGGDLLCCDKCPASFHLQCHDPPLEEDDIPIGQWSCRSCKVAAAKADGAAVKDLKFVKTELVKADHEDIEAKGSDTDESRGRLRTRKDSVSSKRKKSISGRRSNRSSVSEVREDESSGDETGGKLRKLDHSEADELAVTEGFRSKIELLIDAAIETNPKEFNLNQELMVPLPFPGTDKGDETNVSSLGPTKVTCRRNSAVKKKSHELDNGLVSLPVRTCHACSKSCRISPLISCDYCTLFFHMDCLDPPLACLPTAKWMCPSHSQKFIDSRLVTSARTSERIQLWDKYAGAVNEESIKLEFIRKIRRKFPPFKYRVKLPKRSKIRVPEAIRSQYAAPQPLVPSLKEVLRVGKMTGLEQNSTAEEQEQWLTSVVAMQSNIACHLALSKQSKTTDNISEESKTKDIVELTIEKQLSEKKNKSTNNNNDVINGNIVQNCSKQSSDSVESMMEKMFSDATKKDVATYSGSKTLESLLRDPNNSEKKKILINGPITRDAKIILQQNGETRVRVREDNEPKLKEQIDTKVIDNLNKRLQDILTEQGSLPKELTDLDQKLVQLLAYQRIQELFGVNKQSENEIIKSQGKLFPTSSQCLTESTDDDTILGSLERNLYLKDGVLMCKKQYVAVKDEALGLQLKPFKVTNVKVDTPDADVDIVARAVLTQVGMISKRVKMKYRSLTIGTSYDNDVCLSEFGNCNFVSPKHAIIFFDEMTKHYELINYSEHGTSVDSVVYSTNYTDKSIHLDSLSQDRNPLAKQVRDIIDKRRGIAKTEEITDHKMASKARLIKRECSCQRKSSPVFTPSLRTGWEGSAVLYHCSYIKFGCLDFIFAITDHATPPSVLPHPITDFKITKRGKQRRVREDSSDMELTDAIVREESEFKNENIDIKEEVEEQMQME